MKVQIRERDVTLTEAVRAHVAQRLGLALGRYASSIGVVTVRFSTAEGEKRCEIEAGLRPRKVRAEDTNTDLFAAFDHASGRMSSAVGRALEREADWEHKGAWAHPAGGSGPRAPGGSRARNPRRSKT